VVALSGAFKIAERRETEIRRRLQKKCLLRYVHSTNRRKIRKLRPPTNGRFAILKGETLDAEVWREKW
jgi:hypothetical protein